MEYWGDYPPTHLLVRAYMGAGKGGGQRPVSTDAEVGAFLGNLERLGG